MPGKVNNMGPAYHQPPVPPPPPPPKPKPVDVTAQKRQELEQEAKDPRLLALEILPDEELIELALKHSLDIPVTYRGERQVYDRRALLGVLLKAGVSP